MHKDTLVLPRTHLETVFAMFCRWQVYTSGKWDGVTGLYLSSTR